MVARCLHVATTGWLTLLLCIQQTGKGKKAAAAAAPPKAALSWQQKRKLKTEKESSQRQEALTTAIPSSNIGFKMLQQMGYKPGVALGKSGQGATEPITVDLKLNRTGLGRDRVVAEEKVLKAKVKAMVQEKKRLKVDELREGFRERRRGSWQRWKLVRDYRKACVALLQLEEASNPKPKAESQGEGREKEKEKEKNGDGGKEEGEEEEEEEEEVITDEVINWQCIISPVGAITSCIVFEWEVLRMEKF